MAGRCSFAILLLAAVVLAFGLLATPALSSPTVSRTLQFTVVKRTATYVVVERGSLRLVVKSGSRFVSVHGAPRYRVIKRDRSYCLLMPLVNVVAHGATHDGRTNDTAAIVKAMRAAVNSRKGVYLPAGTYRVSSVVMPAGLAVYGAGMSKTWLKGHLDFSSNALIGDMRIGDAGDSAVHNAAGASGTVFRRVRFRGGGGSPGGIHAPVISLGVHGSCSSITFKSCEVERNLGQETSSFANCYNNITVYESRNAHVSDITFDGCHLGVSNGVASGSPRMGLECWTTHAGAGGSPIGWRRITVRGCVFEATAIVQLDFACYGDTGQGDGVLVEGCTLKGGGADVNNTLWGYAICLEWPKDVVIRDNTFHRCHEAAIYCANFGQSYDTRWLISGNTFDWDTAEEGITARRGIVVITGANNTITGNTFTWHGSFSGAPGNGCVEFAGANATGNTVTGNAFNVSQTQRIAVEWGGATGNGSPWTSTNTVKRL